jgi:telomerase reverse transcriptase
MNPSRLGSSIFSIGDIYDRVKAFKGQLGRSLPQLYFAKVDVKAAFDTIPQDAVLEILRRIPNQSRYLMSKHVEINPLETDSTKTSKRWLTTGRVPNDSANFLDRLEAAPNTAARTNTVFIDSAAQRSHRTHELLELTTKHVKQNLVRIGKKYYRQKTGIPQGSVLSTTLCSYFYADLEANHLEFLTKEDSLLLRLTDDFLLITTDQSKAERFVRVMHAGVPAYGVSVSPGKSLVSFELAIQDTPVPRVEDPAAFPYCGLAIDCGTLEIRKQRQGEKDPVVFHALTVEFSRRPGWNFKRKVISTYLPLNLLSVVVNAC